MGVAAACPQPDQGERKMTQTAAPADEKLARVVFADLCEFARDMVSSTTRVYLSYRLMIVFAVDNNLAFATALLLGGARAFNTSTDWLRRSRARAATKLQSSEPTHAELLLLFLKGAK
jgi:hypothetical protein